jgi:ribosomal protein S18 acetylase RimI-like enzyme
MRPFQFRAAISSDLDYLVALVESAYRGDVSRVGWTTEADLLDGQRTSKADLAPILIDPNSMILLAQDEATNTLLACCHLEKQNASAYFGMFAVAPNLQGSGLGKQMMLEAERIARDEFKAEHIEMTVIDIRSELIEFYQRRGYERTGIYKPFPYGDARFGLPKRDDLRFEVLIKHL